MLQYLLTEPAVIAAAGVIVSSAKWTTFYSASIVAEYSPTYITTFLSTSRITSFDINFSVVAAVVRNIEICS